MSKLNPKRGKVCAECGSTEMLPDRKFCGLECRYKFQAKNLVGKPTQEIRYEPTPEQIKASCEEIQQGWTLADRIFRATDPYLLDQLMQQLPEQRTRIVRLRQDRQINGRLCYFADRES